MSVPTKVLRCAFWGLLALYAVAAIGFLGLRYWVLPRADEWRPRIEQYASQALGVPVSIDHIGAEWRGLNPRLRLLGVRIHGAEGGESVLTIPSVSAVLAWRSVLRMAPTLLSLRVEGADITLRRDSDNHLWVAGQSIDLSANRSDGGSPLVAWLSRQRELVFYDAIVRWQDDARQVPEISLHKLDLLVRNGSLSHRFSVRAKPPQALASSIVLRGEFNRSLFSGDARDPASWSGQLYAELNDAEPRAWRPWLDLPDVQGRLATRAWLQIDHGKFTDLTADVLTRNLGWHAANVVDVQTDKQAVAFGAKLLRWRVQGYPGDLLQLSDVPLVKSADGAGMQIKASASDVTARLPAVFEHPDLAAREFDVDASFRRPEGQPLRMELKQLHLANDDLEARLYGSWVAQGEGAAGTADLRGSLSRARMNAIHRYLPLEVNADAREWLAIGLPQGDIRDAALIIKGDLDDFPFGQPGNPGNFRIAGSFSGATIDYAPPHGNTKGWPKLEQMGGNFAVEKASLSIDSPGGGIIRTSPKDVIQIGAITARIPDMEHNAQLLVDGTTTGAVAGYLALAANSPLGGLLDDALAEAQGTGNWKVPLKLDVPLLKAEDTSVKGQVVFSGNSFSFMPEIPLMDNIHGELDFSEFGVQTKDIQAQFLGGPARIWGKMEKGSEPLRFEGTLAGSALTQVINAKAMTRLTGKTAYRGQLNYLRGGSVDLSVQTDLKGMEIKMPAPLGKKAADALPLSLQWGPASDAGNRDRRWLTGSVGENINLLLERDPASRINSYFARGALGVNRAATLPREGLTVAATLPEVDKDAWDTVIDEFDVPALRTAKAAASQPTLPALTQVSLNTGKLRSSGLDLTDLKLFGQRPTPTQWRVDLESHQATGRLEWTEASGAIAGNLSARLKHLSLGSASDANKAEDTLSTGNDLSDIPAIDLQVQEFSLYDKPLGSLQLLGTNLERGQLWRLEKLQIKNPDLTLDAKGSWRLDGKERGLDVEAKAEFGDLGNLLDRLGLKQVAAGGEGHVQAEFSWRNLPWTHNPADIQGHAQVSVDKGRFLNVNSRTARLLELLSFQSLQRLAKLDLNPVNLMRDGFPYDTLRGDMVLDNGVLKTENYKVNGPVAAILLAGNANIITERWDLRAVVVPNLDASGATLATAIINPLVGLGAFVTQWLLKNPLSRAMSMEYKVTGPWDDPKVEPVETPASTPQKRLPDYGTGH